MHIVFNTEDERDIRHFRQTFSRGFKSVNRKLHEIHPPTSHLCSHPLVDMHSFTKLTSVVFYINSTQITAFIDIRLAKPRPQRCYTLSYFPSFLSFFGIFDYAANLLQKKCFHSLQHKKELVSLGVTEKLFIEDQTVLNDLVLTRN